MDRATVTIQCQNITCLASNPETNQFCEKCGIPLVRRYLWVIGDWVKNYYPPGTLLEERYLFTQAQIVLDTKPALSPQAPEDFPAQILPYLKLFPHRLHIPQIYGYIPTPDRRIDMNIWFLEYGTIPCSPSGELKYPDLLPQLTELWPGAAGIRQLNWLWQMARLWQPLDSQRVVSSLLNPNLLLVNNRVIQLRELQIDTEEVPSIKQLGQLWSQWAVSAAANIQDFLTKLCDNLERERITKPEELIAILDRALLEIGRSQQRSYQILTATDTGPMRDHNEDACYPSPAELVRVDEPQPPLAIVCDGIGGQEGGEIASQLAIETLLREINKDGSAGNPEICRQRIEDAVLATNAVISERNDRENRQERQRMGTTLLMSLGYDHQMYITHVGDSRVYWITPTSCHQITVDDDLASREVRLGFLIYRDAIQYPNAGALVQALGMAGASSLHPNIERFIVDEDCIFLLCSDGLSDYDRVDQFWSTEIAPILTGDKNLNQVVPQLISLANEKNGHDNVTVALVHCQVKPKEGHGEAAITFPDLESLLSSVSGPTMIEDYDEDEMEYDDTMAEAPTRASTAPLNSESPEPTEPPPAAKSSAAPWRILLALLGLLLIGSGVYWGNKLFLSNPSGVESPTTSPPDTSTPSTEPYEPPIPSLGELMAIKKIAATEVVELTPKPEENEPTEENEAEPKGFDLRGGEVLKVLQLDKDNRFVLLGLCLPKEGEEQSATKPEFPQGWIALDRLPTIKDPNFQDKEENYNCPPVPQSPQPSEPTPAESPSGE